MWGLAQRWSRSTTSPSRRRSRSDELPRFDWPASYFSVPSLRDPILHMKELAEKVISGRSEDWLGDLDMDAIRAAVALSPDAVEEEAA